ncbi:MAG: cellulose biosynthesis protein BcsQ [Myxococcota bacterium]
MAAVRIAFAGLKGGTGRTATVATLAETLTNGARSVLAVDVDQQNALGTYLGMDPAEPAGLIDANLGTGSVREVLERHEAVTPYVPFGRASTEQLWQWTAAVATGQVSLDERLSGLTPPRCEIVLIDTPAGRTPVSLNTLKSSDTVLVVLEADAASYATIPATEEFLEEALGAGYRECSHYLVNRYDSARALARDVLDAMRDSLGSRVVPFTVHEDEGLRENIASAGRQGLASESQIALDFKRLGDWLVERARPRRLSVA